MNLTIVEIVLVVLICSVGLMFNLRIGETVGNFQEKHFGLKLPVWRYRVGAILVFGSTIAVELWRLLNLLR